MVKHKFYTNNEPEEVDKKKKLLLPRDMGLTYSPLAWWGLIYIYSTNAPCLLCATILVSKKQWSIITCYRHMWSLHKRSTETNIQNKAKISAPCRSPLDNIIFASSL